METVSILGTDYTIQVKKYDEDEIFARCNFAAYCNGYTKEIVLCDMSTYKGCEHESRATLDVLEKQQLRHEIIHAFYIESGLDDNCFAFDGPWANNEEMVEWFALQGPKIYKAWQSAGCL